MTPELKADLETLFTAQMTILYPGMPLLFSNVPVPDTVDVYAVMHVLASEEAFPINLGIESKTRNVGLIQVDVFTPKDQGSGEAHRIAYAAGNIFKRQVRNILTEGTVTLKDPSVTDRGEVRGRHKQMMRIPYRYDFKD